MKALDIPLCLGGHITPAPPSFCLDNATHILNTPLAGCFRIKPSNDEAKRVLDHLSGKEISAVVCGHQKQTANCQHIEAYYVAEAAAAAPLLQNMGN